jgi:hypothetical protein
MLDTIMPIILQEFSRKMSVFLPQITAQIIDVKIQYTLIQRMVVYCIRDNIFSLKIEYQTDKKLLSLYDSLVECVQIGTTFFIYFPVLLLYAALAIGICAAFNIFSIIKRSESASSLVSE